MSAVAARPEVTRSLGDVGKDDVALAGGKGANLGELVRAGFPVPDGFIVMTDAYTASVALDGADVAHAREHVLSAPVPAPIADAIRAAYRKLGSPPVAVRSSATAEDLPDASFAGQQDTFLGVAGEDAVIDAVRRCWASLWNDRAVAYRISHGLAAGDAAIAVIVERMVDAAAAGVLFTADPLTGTRRRASIDAVRGLGEQLVAGRVNPDHYVFDNAAGRLLDSRGDTLSADEVRTLAEIGQDVERHFGRPQDIEWAIDRDGKIWLVQSRDVTTLYPLPAGLPDPQRDLRLLFSANVAQGVFDPFTPMGLQTFRLIAAALSGVFGRHATDPEAGAPVMVEAAMRIFLDLTPLVRSAAGREIVPRVLTVMEARSAPLVEHLLQDPRLAVRERSGLGSRLAAIRAIIRTGLPAVVVRTLLRPDAMRLRLLREVDAIVRSDVGPLGSAVERVEAFHRLFVDVPPRMFPRLLGTAASGLLSLIAATRLLGDRATQDELRTILRGLSFNPTTEMDLALWDLARRAGADPASRAAIEARSPTELAADYRAGALPPTLQRDLEGFLERYGHRAIGEIDLGLPRWSEDPAHLLGAVANYQRLGDARLAPDAQFARGVREAEAMAATLVGRVRGPRRVLVRALLRRVRALTGLREVPKFNIVRVFARGRAILAPVGDELAAAGRIQSPDDVWFLTLAEIRLALAGSDMRPTVAARRDEYRRELRRRHVPRVLLSDGTDVEFAYAQPAMNGAIRGTPASPGVASGVARVIHSPVGARLDPGEVLVAPSTDPGWTPLFLTAGALVMEMGGMMSHGAVVAREYGIPAVVGVPDATGRIVTGAKLTVDGSAGTVAVES